eukprot:285048-Pleurochrysis_carterae.AAC.1
MSSILYASTYARGVSAGVQLDQGWERAIRSGVGAGRHVAAVAWTRRGASPRGRSVRSGGARRRSSLAGWSRR